MRARIAILTLLILLMACSMGSAQEEKQSWASDHLEFSGYVKYLNISTFSSLDSVVNDNLLHNRLNFKVYANDLFTAGIELRNRIFWGTSVQNIPDYAQLVKSSNQDIDMSALVVNKPALIGLSTIDRLYLDFHSGKWQVILGRQRINWGKNLVWNPNDLFNAYSFVDFDYEERPGSDALRAQYYVSGNASWELAINYADAWNRNTFALKYNFNKFEYDFQVLAGKYLEDFVFGLGWEGAIKTVGIKGEFSYFSSQGNADQSKEVLVGSISLDYYFKNGLSLNLSSLYNGNGITALDDFDVSQFSSTTLNAKQLMPNRWSYFAQVSDPITPAITASMAAIYAQELNTVFFMPQFQYAISQNWGFDVTGQIFYGKQDDSFSNIGNSVFLRFRFDF
ncbi:MAG: hypothetical protein R2819_06940 [Allomuricauda sp.]